MRTESEVGVRGPRSGSTTFHPALENQDGGHPVYGFAPFLDREVGFPQQAVCLRRGQAFVPKVYGQFEVLAQVLGEILDLLGLDTLCATHAQREADDDLFHLIIPDDTIQITEIVFLVLPMEGFQALCGNAERVRYGYTDSTRPDIEPEDAMGWVCEVGSHAGIIVGFRLSARQGLGVMRPLTSFHLIARPTLPGFCLNPLRAGAERSQLQMPCNNINVLWIFRLRELVQRLKA